MTGKQVKNSDQHTVSIYAYFVSVINNNHCRESIPIFEWFLYIPMHVLYSHARSHPSSELFIT